MPTSTYQDESHKNVALLVKVAIAAFVLIVGLFVFKGQIGHNDNQNWQILQSVNGKLTVIGNGGYYNKWFGNVWTYPKYIQLNYTEEKSEDYPSDDSIIATFNDGGTAKMSSVLRIETPTSDAQRIAFHQQFPDYDGRHAAIRGAIKAHLANCIKSTGPLMSASEHQTARKSEFTQVVQEQLTVGLYEMRRVERTLKDQFDAKGQPITVFATEIVQNSKGQPIISEPSPLSDVGVTIMQFSIVDTTYDEQTVNQFKIKKEAFLQGESSKAQREQEVQKRLMVIEKGLREKAEIEAESNKSLAAATIDANQKLVVAETNANQEKSVAETNAAKLVAVATQTKIAAETEAAQEKEVAEIAATRELDVAKLNREAAEENAKKQIALANAQKESLAIGGGISEHDRVLATISADRDVRVAEQLAKINVPATVISGGSNGTGNVTQDLINISLMKSTGIIPNK